MSRRSGAGGSPGSRRRPTYLRVVETLVGSEKDSASRKATERLPVQFVAEAVVRNMSRDANAVTDEAVSALGIVFGAYGLESSLDAESGVRKAIRDIVVKEFAGRLRIALLHWPFEATTTDTEPDKTLIPDELTPEWLRGVIDGSFSL